MADQEREDSSARRPGIKIYRTSLGEAESVRDSAYGRVGLLHTDQRFEVVWIWKQREAIDTHWFAPEEVDVLIVIQGQLRMEFLTPEQAPVVLEPGDAAVLSPGTRCRAYRWPRETSEATIFLAAYPKRTS